MNLVIDDAVEVRLATKTEEEKRRPLGRDFLVLYLAWKKSANFLAIQARSCSRATMCL